MAKSTSGWRIINWIFGLVFLIIGLLNIIYIDLLTGIFYILLSFLYFPPIEVLTGQKLGFALPHWLKAIMWLLIMWGTLAVGDLAELAGL